MIVECQCCHADTEASTASGVMTCEGCGALVVWPTTSQTLTVDEDAIDSALGAATKQHGMRLVTFLSIAEKVERRDTYWRAGYQVRRKEVDLRTSSGKGTRANQVVPLPDPDEVDPWEADAKLLPTESKVVCVCPDCEGAKKVDCQTCVGIGRVGCAYCDESGRVMGKNKMKNCPKCRGSGNVKCPNCTRGLIPCETCAKSGRVYAWLQIRNAPYTAIRIHPRGPGCDVHPRLEDETDFTTPAESHVNALTADTGWGKPSRCNVPDILSPRLDERRDRLRATRLQTFQATVTNFDYSTLFGRGTIVISGDPPAVVESSDFGPIKSRRSAARIAGGAGVFIGMLTTGAYLSQHPWFGQFGNAPLLFGLAACLGLASSMATLQFTLPAPARTGHRIGSSMAGLLLVIGGLATAWTSGGPSMASAERALAEGAIDSAEFELAALQAIETDAVVTASLEAKISDAKRRVIDTDRLEKVRSASTAAAGAYWMAEAWHDEEVRQRAIQLHLAQARKEIDGAYRNHDHVALATIGAFLERSDQAMAKRAAMLSRFAKLTACSNQGDFECADTILSNLDRSETWATDYDQAQGSLTSKLARSVEASIATGLDPTKTPESRVRALDKAVVEASLYEKWRGAPLANFEPQKIQRSRAKADKAWSKQKKKEAGIARREAAKQRRLEAKAEADRARQRRCAAPLLCRDGTESPSCTCCGSRRGCCSRHGGVAGCSL